MNTRCIVAGFILMLTLWFTQNADAVGIESLVMPGDVIEGHADIESECSSCHISFDREGQRALCLDCHKDVAKDIVVVRGFHGLSSEAKSQSCASCHVDHEGRSASIVELNERTFDHRMTDFILKDEHLTASCGDCHSDSDKHRDAPSDCLSCHTDDDVHDTAMGTECGDCHSESGWQDVSFDHSTTGYVLLGGHLEADCLGCHADQTFEETPGTCFGCHESDDVHKGRSGTDCDSCHNPVSWTDTSFSHERDTTFALSGKHSELTCDDCHSDEPFSDRLESNCLSCHLDDDEHKGHFGAQCQACHSDSSWSESAFNHDMDTGHSLLGAHSSIACSDCHIEPVFDVSLQGGCNDCHVGDDPHKGDQGIQCNDCHNEVSWQDDVFFDHGLTMFPLLGEHESTECASCHLTHVFTEASTDCVDCHQEEDPHGGRYQPLCADCHTPVDWNRWFFDHDVSTSFRLDGAHANATCDGCHRQSLVSMKKTGSRCGDCHRADDVHDGEFGTDCARCHSSDSFRDVRSIQ